MKTIPSLFLISLAVAGMLLVAAGQAATVEPAGAPASAGGQTALIIGHSLAHCLRALEPLAAMVGHPAHQQSLYTFLGAGIAYHYQTETNPGTPVSWRKLYFGPGRKWDALIMSARDANWKDPKLVSSDEIYAPKFAAEAFKLNPRCQIFIYGNWPEVAELDNPPFGNTEAHIERVAAAVDKAFPQAPKTRAMPCCLLLRELGSMADRGELPGVNSRFEFFSDGVHPNCFSSYAINVLVMAMLYNESPLAYPAHIHPAGSGGKEAGGDLFKDAYVTERGGPAAQRLPSLRGNVFKDIEVPDDTAAVIKRVVWDVLQTYPPARMPAGLVIANRRLEPAIAGQPYKVQLKALNAAGPCAWAIVKGTLPQGMSLARDGVLGGQTAAAGDYRLTIQLTDDKSRFERPLLLRVTPDRPPMIPEQPLADVPLDAYIFKPLEVEGGVGGCSWSVSEGKLPYGVRLAPAGILAGTPGEAGDFTFKVKAADSHPAGAHAGEREFHWKIGPARPESLQLKYVVKEDHRLKDWAKVPADACIKIDGKLDEPFWKLDQPIAKKVRGAPQKRASFSAVWTAACHGNGPRPGHYVLGKAHGRTWTLEGREVVLGIKVLDGPKGKTPKDGVHVFLDARHDGKTMYDADDTHFFVPRDFRSGSGWAPIVRGLKPPWFSKAAVAEIEGGYTMEISLGNPNFHGDGQWLGIGARSVFGLDIAVDEGDGKEIARQVWRGDANDAEDTSHFGTIVLTAEPALATQVMKESGDK